MHRTAKSLQHHMVPLEKMVDESIALIVEHEPPEGYFVGFSGGKDSIVTLELARMSGCKHEAYYFCTGIDPPEVVKFIKQHYLSVKWLYPKMSFWTGIDRECTPPLKEWNWKYCHNCRSNNLHSFSKGKFKCSNCGFVTIEHNTNSPDCWCDPEIEEIDGNLLVIHRDKSEAN